MHNACRLAVFGCLLCTSQSRAAQGEAIALDKLPHQASRAIKEMFPGTDFLHVRKVVEDGNECYVVTVLHEGRKGDYYVSRHGHVFAKQDFSLAVLPKRLLGFFVLGLVPGAISAAAARALTQAAKGRQLSVLSGWFVAWVGAVIGIGILLSQLATVPHEKDIVVFGLISAICGGISASIVVLVSLIVHLLRGHRIESRWSIVGNCAAVFFFLILSVPVDLLRIERENAYFMTKAMKLPRS